MNLQREDWEPSISIALLPAPGEPPQQEAVGMGGTSLLPTDLGLGMLVFYQKAERTLDRGFQSGPLLTHTFS